MNLLIIEDNFLHQKILVFIFKKFKSIKINCFVKKNGQEALDFLKSTSFGIDLIFTDIKMPVMDGVQFCEEFRKIDSKTPIVVMTCNYELHNSDTMKTATHFTKKPVDFESVKNIVDYYSGFIDHSNNKMAYK